MSNKLERVYTRFLEILNYMDKKYVDFLEEIVSLEAEVMSSSSEDSVSKALLFYINIVKNIIAKELGVKLDSVSLVSDSSVESVEKISNAIETYT